MEKYKTLHIVWTFDNEHCARFMVFGYAINALKQGHMEKARITVCGLSIRMLCENAYLQASLKEFQALGGTVCAAREQAEDLHMLENLASLGGITICDMGKDFEITSEGNDEKLMML